MDYVRDGKIQGQCAFKKTKERPCIISDIVHSLLIRDMMDKWWLFRDKSLTKKPLGRVIKCTVIIHTIFCILTNPNRVTNNWAFQMRYQQVFHYPLVLTFYSTRLARQKFYLEQKSSSESSWVKLKNGIHSTRFHCFVSSEFRVLVEYFLKE